jgi:hypothetical protein
MVRRPLAVTILACIYIAAGTIGFVYHLREFRAAPPILWGLAGVEIVRLLAIVAGVFLLRGRNWARWLAIGWIVFHAIVSAFHTASQFAVHAVFCAVFAWILFRHEASLYFRGRPR